VIVGFLFLGNLRATVIRMFRAAGVCCCRSD